MLNAVAAPWADTMFFCTKYCLIPQNIIKIITIWHTVPYIYGLGVWFCCVYGGGGGRGEHWIN